LLAGADSRDRVDRYQNADRHDADAGGDDKRVNA
jgi:hypothetical protein